jgi:hypothetical protein
MFRSRISHQWLQKPPTEKKRLCSWSICRRWRFGESEVTEQLESAAVACGLSVIEAQATFQSGVKAGKLEPRDFDTHWIANLKRFMAFWD